VFAEAGEDRLCLSVAALWQIKDEGFLPPEKTHFKDDNLGH